MLGVGPGYRSGGRLEPLIVLYPCHDSAGRGRDHPWRMRGGEQRHVEPGGRPGRAALQDRLWHLKRRTDDRPLQRTVRAQATRRPNGSRAHDGRDPAGSAGANGGRHPARSTRCCACLVNPARDRNRVDPPGQTRDRVDATSSAGPGPRRSRATSGPATASSRAGRTHGLWHHVQRTDDRSVHRVVWAQASRRPVSVKSYAEPAANIRQR